MVDKPNLQIFSDYAGLTLFTQFQFKKKNKQTKKRTGLVHCTHIIDYFITAAEACLLQIMYLY